MRRRSLTPESEAALLTPKGEPPDRPGQHTCSHTTPVITEPQICILTQTAPCAPVANTRLPHAALWGGACSRCRWHSPPRGQGSLTRHPLSCSRQKQPASHHFRRLSHPPLTHQRHRHHLATCPPPRCHHLVRGSGSSVPSCHNLPNV